jgi:hypothetical protein
MPAAFTDFDDEFFRQGDELSATHEAAEHHPAPVAWRRWLVLVPVAVLVAALAIT